MTRLRAAAAVLLVAAAGCDFGQSSSSLPTAPDQSGVQYAQTDLTIGTGAEATPGTTATAQYGLWLYSETAPDHKGTQLQVNQVTFVIGGISIIKGFDMGVTGM